MTAATSLNDAAAPTAAGAALARSTAICATAPVCAAEILPAVSVVGLGPGDEAYLTLMARRLIGRCEVLIGSARQLACFPHFGGEKRPLDRTLGDLAHWLASHRERRVVVLASGDPMLYGIGDYLSRHMPPGTLAIIPGISAVQYLFARLGLAMNEVYLASSHGREPDFDFLLRHAKVAMVTDRRIGPYEIARQILARALRRTLVVGENLSYPNERIHILLPEQVARAYDMNVVVILDEQ
ncbi:cobalt-precorrin-7 (C(5))-methyltransferase [Martelella alba]|uniref:Cobalt-precorrin-7 (C(5))-methyltransferase n=2 Tax=Martelella alba TaxID=2590451 RepID=A0ABY2SSE6_9HYPH|nr:cobalt-precorrin-7 (C(5))-methyltransferase [Martelella alba]